MKSTDTTLPQEISIMAIIPQENQTSNNYFSSAARLPSLQFKLLKLYYEEWAMGIYHSDRSLVELGHLFNRHPKTISAALVCLHENGLMEKFRSGSSASHRGITMWGISYLENQTRNETRSQTDPIPYIDLSKIEESDIKILEDEQICGQLDDPDPEIELEQRLEHFLESRMVSSLNKNRIKSHFKCSQIGYNRKRGLLERLTRGQNSKPISNHFLYVKSALENEERQIHHLKQYFHTKPITVNLYA